MFIFLVFSIHSAWGCGVLIRLWFKTNLKLCKLWFDMKEFSRMSKMLKVLHKSCQNEDGTDDQKKGTQLLEVKQATLDQPPA